MSKTEILVDYINHHRIKNIKDYFTVCYARWDNAVNSFRSGDYFTAIYLSGYCIECILKYVILKELYSKEASKPNGLDITKIPKIYKENEFKHNLAGLIKIGNEKKIFDVPKESDFKELIKWKSEWRYAKSHNIDSEDIAKEFLDSVVEFSIQLKANSKIKVNQFKKISSTKVIGE